MDTMNHQDIVKLVKSMEIAPLTMSNLDFFIQTATGLLVPGTSFQQFFSPGYNSRSMEKYDFSQAKPEWRASDLEVVSNIEQKEIPAEGKKWINVDFVRGGYELWGVSPERTPLLFGFIPNKAIYVAEQADNGTPQFPWETLYLRLD